MKQQAEALHACEESFVCPRITKQTLDWHRQVNFPEGKEKRIPRPEKRCLCRLCFRLMGKQAVGANGLLNSKSRVWSTTKCPHQNKCQSPRSFLHILPLVAEFPGPLLTGRLLLLLLQLYCLVSQLLARSMSYWVKRSFWAVVWETPVSLYTLHLCLLQADFGGGGGRSGWDCCD